MFGEYVRGGGAQHLGFDQQQGESMSTEAGVSISVDGGVTVVSLTAPEFENIDERNIDQARSALLELAQATTPPLLVLDLSATKFFGSSFIEALFRTANRMKSRGGKFALSGLGPYCMEVIQITRLDSLWPVTKTSQEAVAKLKEAA